MPLPLIIGIAAGIAAIGGVGSGIQGGMKMKKANDTMKEADKRHQENIAKFERKNKSTTYTMDALGKTELSILSTFQTFSDLIESIKNRPEFKDISVGDVHLPKYSAEEIDKASVGAAVLIGGLSGAAAGTAGGFAAAGATTAAVMAIGTASTGTAIASLSGIAATNATLAALGGGAIAAGGGGMALGSAILGGATLGVGLLVGGIIFNITGSGLNGKADKAWEQMMEAESTINKICAYLENLKYCAAGYLDSISKVNNVYNNHLSKLIDIVRAQGKSDWNEFSVTEKLVTQNTVLLVQLLYQMCKVQLVLKSNSSDGMNRINYNSVDKTIINATTILNNIESIN